MAMFGKVKRMHFREKKSSREIVRLTSLSRHTARKWLKAAEREEPRYRRSDRPGKLTAFHEALKPACLWCRHLPHLKSRLRPSRWRMNEDGVQALHPGCTRVRRSLR